MSEEQARAAAISDGFDAADITPEVLSMYGFKAPDPLANVTVAPPAVSQAEIDAAKQAGQDEAKSNQLPAQVLQGVKDVVGVVAPIVKGVL